MKIAITRNCANGEHIFIPAQTYVEGRETMHTAFVCQHCLYYVSSQEWDAHIRANFEKSEPETYAEPSKEAFKDPNYKGLASDVVIEDYKIKGIAIPTDTSPRYPGKKRGPKPKGTVKGL